MRHKHSINKTPWYMYVLGGSLKAVEYLKKIFLAAVNHLTEIGMVVAFVGMVIAYQAFEIGCINFITMMLFIAILGLLLMCLLKIKLLENGEIS